MLARDQATDRDSIDVCRKRVAHCRFHPLGEVANLQCQAGSAAADSDRRGRTCAVGTNLWVRSCLRESSHVQLLMEPRETARTRVCEAWKPHRCHQNKIVECEIAIIGRMTEVTKILSQVESGDPTAAEDLLPLVYDELRKLAAAQLSHERPGQTLQATALVHEAYMKLVDQRRVDWKNRAHFFAIAARAMRRILLDHAGARNAEKRGGGAPAVTLGDEVERRDSDLDEILALDQAMNRLAALDARQARVVELRFFAGMTLEEIAEVMEMSLGTVNRDWRTARAFLARELRR